MVYAIIKLIVLSPIYDWIMSKNRNFYVLDFFYIKIKEVYSISWEIKRLNF